MSSSALIVAGTDTGVGKTVVAAMLTAALEADYYKPIQSGAKSDSDTDTVLRLAALPTDRVRPEMYELQEPLSPHRAAELDGVIIEPSRLKELPLAQRPLIVELAGGLLVPITRTLLQIDLAARWRAPFVLVARTGLGTINHTLLSVEALRARNCRLLGVIFVGKANEDNERTICELSGVKRLGRLPTLKPLDRNTLHEAFCENFTVGDFGVASAAHR